MLEGRKINRFTSQVMTGSILLVDDDPDMRKIIITYLGKNGFTFYEASDGIQGKKLFDEKKPNLVLLDLQMPNMSGIELLKAIKRESYENLVIVITGEGGINDTLEALKIGAFDYILKPFTQETLTSAIEKAFQELRLMMKI